MILSFSESEEYMIQKILEVLGNKQGIDCIYTTDDSILFFEDMQILHNQRKVISKGIEIELTTREFDILYTLARYHNQVLTVQQIYKAVTGEESVEDYHSIESSIYSIRKKLGHDVIETVRGYGYKFSKNDGNRRLYNNIKSPVFMWDCLEKLHKILRKLKKK